MAIAPILIEDMSILQRGHFNTTFRFSGLPSAHRMRTMPAPKNIMAKQEGQATSRAWTRILTLRRVRQIARATVRTMEILASTASAA